MTCPRCDAQKPHTPDPDPRIQAMIDACVSAREQEGRDFNDRPRAVQGGLFGGAR